ncbi:MAG: 50S ribosomal protein L24 [Oscillospiraceae bacterium]|nr:50S ribosomal protein L24 [Oscillospiraceae bacterium]
MNIKTNDTVVVLSGKDKGKKGKILAVMPTTGKLLVEGVNVCAHHVKPRRQGEEGGIIRKETPIRAPKVMLVCPKCNKPTRISYKMLADGGKSRVCKKCGETI